MKLYKSKAYPDHWVAHVSIADGTDQHGILWVWPATKGGWRHRMTYERRDADLEEVDPALARGTGWPGVPRSARGPMPRAGVAAERRTIRATDAEVAAWSEAAAPGSWRTWATRTLNEAAGRSRS